MTNNEIKFGDIYYADLRPTVGSEQGGIRPVIIVQNNVGNKHSPTVMAAAITSQSKPKLPTHMVINPNQSGLEKISTILFEQIRTIDKKRLKARVGHVDDSTIRKVQEHLCVSFGLTSA